MEIFKSTSRTFFYIGLIIIMLTLFTIWLDKATQSEREKIQPTDDNSDYFMQNFSLTSMNDAGEAYQWLSGDRLAHYPNNEVALLSPKLILRSEGGRQWQVSANEGEIDPENNIELKGNVSIVQASEKETTYITTSHLTVSQDRQTAETNAHVTVSSNNGTVTAKGMRANLPEQQLHLLSEVKGIYAQ